MDFQVDEPVRAEGDPRAMVVTAIEGGWVWARLYGEKTAKKIPTRRINQATSESANGLTSLGV